MSRNKLLLCPYDKAHEIEPERMQFHLSKCGKNYPNSEIVSCIFNNTHRVPKPEIEYHQSICQTRSNFDAFMHPTEGIACPIKDMVPVGGEDYPSSMENWDDEPPCPSTLETVKSLAKEKPVLRVPKGCTKSERKKFRKVERSRISELRGGSTSQTEVPPSGSKGNRQKTDDDKTNPLPGKNSEHSQVPPTGRGRGRVDAKTNEPPGVAGKINEPFQVSNRNGDKNFTDGGFCKTPIPAMRGRGRPLNTS